MLKTLLLLAVFCLLLTAPCLARNSFVYVSNYGDGTISQFRERPNGILTPLTPPTVKAHILCHSLAAARGRFLYAVSARDWSKRHCLVSQFRIAANGTLHPLNPEWVFLSDTPASIAVEPASSFAYVFNREGTVTSYRIEADGQLSSLSHAVLKVADAGGVTPIVGFDKVHYILYGSYIVAWHDNVSSGTFSCIIGHDGRLKPSPSYKELADTVQMTDKIGQPYALSITPNGKYAYISESLNGNRPNGQWLSVVAQCKTRRDGLLAPLSPSTVLIETTADSFIDTRGRFLYLLYEKTNDVSMTGQYRLAYAPIGSNGRLGNFAYQALKIQASLPAVQELFSLAFDHTGHFCYFVEGNYLYLFRRQPNGSLSPLCPARLGAGYGPLGIACVQR